MADEERVRLRLLLRFEMTLTTVGRQKQDPTTDRYQGSDDVVVIKE
jgi:hypothetical protein